MLHIIEVAIFHSRLNHNLIKYPGLQESVKTDRASSTGLGASKQLQVSPPVDLDAFLTQTVQGDDKGGKICGRHKVWAGRGISYLS